MENKTSKSLDFVNVLQNLIVNMEKRKEENPEYILRNIQLIDKIQELLENFKQEMIDSMNVYES